MCVKRPFNTASLVCRSGKLQNVGFAAVPPSDIYVPGSKVIKCMQSSCTFRTARAKEQTTLPLLASSACNRSEEEAYTGNSNEGLPSPSEESQQRK